MNHNSYRTTPLLISDGAFVTYIQLISPRSPLLLSNGLLSVLITIRETVIPLRIVYANSKLCQPFFSLVIYQVKFLVKKGTYISYITNK